MEIFGAESLPLTFAFLGGIFPAILWLWLWLKEDGLHPEPKKLIFLTFLMGALAVAVVLPIQIFVYNNFPGQDVLVFFVWAMVEEACKYGAAFVFGLRSKALDEPIDTIMYMITAALGFAAFENTLFLINPAIAGSVMETIVTGSQRFVGASLLHVLSSSVVGIFMAFSFFRGHRARQAFTILGLILAIALHTLFNLSIMDGSGLHTFATFFTLWILVLALLLLFEKVKRLQSPAAQPQPEHMPAPYITSNIIQ